MLNINSMFNASRVGKKVLLASEIVKSRGITEFWGTIVDVYFLKSEIRMRLIWHSNNKTFSASLLPTTSWQSNEYII